MMEQNILRYAVTADEEKREQITHPDTSSVEEALTPKKPGWVQQFAAFLLSVADNCLVSYYSKPI